MKEFLNVLRRFVPPYKKYLVLSVLFNLLSAVLNIFSFAALIPILQILFQTGDAEAATSWMAPVGPLPAWQPMHGKTIRSRCDSTGSTVATTAA